MGEAWVQCSESQQVEKCCAAIAKEREEEREGGGEGKVYPTCDRKSGV